jgi:hypothetical protein
MSPQFPFRDSLRCGVSCIHGHVLHLWHGALENRGYTARHRALERFGFDPYTDVAVDGDGVWRWNSAKPDMQVFVRDYLLKRGEGD